MERRDRVRAAWRVHSAGRVSETPLSPRKTGLRKDEKQGNASSVILLPGVSRCMQQLNVFHERPLNQFRLLRSQFPVALFHGLGQAGKLQMSVRVARSIEQMLEPRTTGNTGGVEPLGFDPGKMPSEGGGCFTRGRAGGEGPRGCFGQPDFRLLEVRRARVEAFLILFFALDPCFFFPPPPI